MDRFHAILLDVWREACRHIEIGESAVNIAAMLADHMPLAALLVYWLDAEHNRLSIAAAAPTEASSSLVSSQTLAAADTQRLSAWIRRGEVTRIASGRRLPPALRNIALPEWPGEVLTAPLLGPHGVMGVVLFAPQTENGFFKKHEAMVEAVREPLAVALENDRRLHELERLREAAEADRRSLLSRLGRSNLGDVVVGEQSGLRHVMERVRQVCRSDAPALILGETGTGKELIARAIHNDSPRRDGPFIRVNCGAVPPELIDAQLFGHEKGSFTGAIETRQGWFERADGGTLFLDEIGELPLDAQVRFLRVLQDGYIERVGGHRPIHVDVRIVAATHRDLAEMVREGRFREDLWYRIAVFPILLPPLRDRKQDIPALVEHFAQKAATRFGLPPVSATPADIKLLESYDWPGNIRELGAVVDRAAILGEGKTLEFAAALGLSSVPSTRRSAPEAERRSTGSGGASSTILSLDDAMRRHIETALRATRGKIEGPNGAAKLLKINPHTLRARMRKLGIDWSQFRETASIGEHTP